MKKNVRIVRINDEIMRETANIIRTEIKDPRVSAMVTVTKAETTTDLEYCKIYISILGDKTQKDEVLAGIKSASGFIRKLLAERINLRLTPQLSFIIDDSLEYGIRLSGLIDEVNKNNRD